MLQYNIRYSKYLIIYEHFTYIISHVGECNPFWFCFGDISLIYIYIYGARGSVVVKALSYKPEGRGIESR
jgi:hypothetical protein